MSGFIFSVYIHIYLLVFMFELNFEYSQGFSDYIYTAYFDGLISTLPVVKFIEIKA